MSSGIRGLFFGGLEVGLFMNLVALLSQFILMGADCVKGIGFPFNVLSGFVKFKMNNKSESVNDL